ncbi:MAG: nucleoside-diphosphate sugar epimerase/dehydratase, partial [Pseudonocardiaceae bacterium]
MRRLVQVAVDAGLIGLAYYLAFTLRFDAGIPARYEDLLIQTVGFVVLMKLCLFALFGLYSKLWRFVDQADFESIVKAVVVASFVLIGALFLLSPTSAAPPRGVIALDFLLTLALVAGARFLVRAVVERPFRGPLVQRADREVLIVGAGLGGQQVALELRRNPELSSAVLGFIDDDPRKQGMLVSGHRVHGRTDDLTRVLDDTKPDEVVIAIPSAPGILRQKVVTACRERDIPVRTLPTTFELLSRGPNLLRQMREVQVEDVLGREPVRSDIDRVGAY